MTPRHPFDPLAAHYWWLERVTFGPMLHWCRTVHIPRLAACRRALVAGDGDGRFLEALLRANPFITVDAVDISPGMTATAHRRTRFAADRVRFTVADIRTAPLRAAGYDLIVTHFLLDCFPADQLESVVSRLAEASRPHGRWLVGDFEVPPGRWRARLARLILGGMYAWFRVVTRLPATELVDPSPLLATHGFTLVASASRLGGFVSSRLWERPVGLRPANQVV